VNIEDRGEGADGADWLDDAHLHIPYACRNGDPFLIHVELRDRRGLNIVQDLPGTFRAKVVKEWGLRRGVCDSLGRAFKNGLLHCVTSFHLSGHPSSTVILLTDLFSEIGEALLAPCVPSSDRAPSSGTFDPGLAYS
jgi:hypothetical protein